MTELEIIVMDWIASMLDLPASMKWTSTGAGVIQGSASESVFLAVLTARRRGTAQGTPTERLVAYLSWQRHASCDKALRLAQIQHVRIIRDAHELEANVVSDIEKVILDIRNRPMVV